MHPRGIRNAPSMSPAGIGLKRRNCFGNMVTVPRKPEDD